MCDRELVQIVDSAMAEAARKSGSWLACRPGCDQCCIGPFPITQLDARRLRQGLADLAVHDPARAARVRQRARISAERIRHEFPENTLTRVLGEEDAAEDELCPVLDPITRTCDLYNVRPITCRIFGPAVRFGSDAVAVCELCYQGATDTEIAVCEVEVDPEGLEKELLEDLERSTGARGPTIVAFALVDK